MVINNAFPTTTLCRYLEEIVKASFTLNVEGCLRCKCLSREPFCDRCDRHQFFLICIPNSHVCNKKNYYVAEFLETTITKETVLTTKKKRRIAN